MNVIKRIRILKGPPTCRYTYRAGKIFCLSMHEL